MDSAGPIDRRCFIKWSLLVGTSVAALPSFGFEEVPAADPAAGPGLAATRIVRAGCPSHNCGGRCLLVLHIDNGIIVRIETDDRPTDGVEAPQLRACIRGRAYRRRQYHPD